MSTVHPSRWPPSGLSILIALAYAGTLGVAARAFGLVAERGRRAAPARSGASAAAPEDAAPDGNAATPAGISPRGWWQVLKTTFSEVGNDRVLAVAGGVTFYALLSLFPALTVLVSLYGLFAKECPRR
jgi:membrane protein